MKLKKLLGLALSGVLTISAIGCRKTQPENIDEKGNNKIVIGASAVPHAEILEEVKPILQEKGYELDIKVFDDYTLLNTALDEGSIDANFFQHVPYLEDTIDGQGYDLTYTAKVHIEPMGLYSKSIKSLDELKENSTIAIPNDASNAARALKLLEDNGVIKLKDVESPGAKDIAENPKNIKVQELDAAQLPVVLVDVDAAVINTNYALEAGLNPTKDAIIIESKESPYANILACRTADKDSKAIKALTEVLNSEEVKEFINEKYSGSIVPAF